MELYHYQTKYLSDLPKNVIMTASVGLGKTIMAIEHARRHGAVDIVVIAPASKVRTGDWQREILNFYKDYEAIPNYTVLSYEMFTKKWKTIISPNTTIIADECHFVCSAKAQRSKAVLLASKLAWQWIFLSATPLPNGFRSAETYAILTGLAKNKTSFVQRFEIIDRSRGFPLLIGYRDEPVLNSWWNKVSKPLQRDASTGVELPSSDLWIMPDMSVKEAKIYKTAFKEHMLGEDMLDNPSKLFVALRQIPMDTRISALQSVIDSTDEHIVVFYNFNSERDAILSMIKKSFKERKIYEQSGHNSDLPKRENWSKLKPSITLVQYQSGSQAIELTYASVTVYLSPCTSYANYEQSKGRTRRNGQSKTTLFYHILIKGTIDERIWKILGEKRNFSEKLFKEYIDE